MKTIGFIGGGRITKIFLQAFKNSQTTFDRITVYDTNAEVLNMLKIKFPYIATTTEDLKDVVNNEVVFIALHPPVMMEILSKIKDCLNKNTLLVSLAPKITLERMAASLGGFFNIARMNPSASSIVNKGVNPIAYADGVSAGSKDRFSMIVKPLGYTPEVAESKIEAYAVISAMGHTYFFFQFQKLKELALSFGMDEKEAQTAISEMLLGTTETLFKSGMPYSEIADLVPVKPMGEVEETIKGYYDHYLTGIYAKIKP